MKSDRTMEWLLSLGYIAEPRALHRSVTKVAPDHLYASELRAILDPEGAIRAEAVYDVEGVPTVVFVTPQRDRALGSDELDAIRQRLWNQNLAVVVVVVKGEIATAMSVLKRGGRAELHLSDAKATGPFSAADFRSGDIQGRLEDWFQVKDRVDSALLANISATVDCLVAARTPRFTSQTLLGQILFISYLEHRGIVSHTYREAHKVPPLADLIGTADTDGICRLIKRLRRDFNGDFLADSALPEEAWRSLSTHGYQVLNDFLQRVDMRSGQTSFWNYDFSFIPVELLSGLYESFLGEKAQKKLGAYYTPRHLATLAVDQLAQQSQDLLQEVVFDGACGSGILLTTMFRRMLALKEAREKRQLSLTERAALLKERIFGADLNEQACRVTAFSLYLSLLEGLQPADIRDLQEKEDVKLPTLRGKNLITGDEGDFFGRRHPFLSRGFTLSISNPPWVEISGEATFADSWAEQAGVPSVRRQIAGLFALRSLDFLAENGMVCMILPISQFLAPTSARFVSAWCGRAQMTSLFNFGDLQGMLFQTAEHTCHVAIARKRKAKDVGRIPMDETFWYSSPKADVSLALGRLTLLSADRHEVQTQAAVADPQRLVTLMWGDQRDLTLWTRLTAHGTYADFWKHSKRWRSCKGFHYEDSAVDHPVSSAPLRAMPFVTIEPLKLGVPVLHASLVSEFPKDVKTVASIGDRMDVFDGPRILFPDGFSREERQIRATYFGGRGSFNSSIGVIAGPKKDEPLLRFSAIYLRSSLAQYFLLTRAYQVLCERNRVSVTDIAAFPFFEPADAPHPQAAEMALLKCVEISRELEKTPVLQQPSRCQAYRDELNQLVYSYFGLSATEQELVEETVNVLLPSVRPRSYESLRTPAQARARARDLEKYCKTLRNGLADWQKRLGGVGGFDVSVVSMEPHHTGPVGVVKITYSADAKKTTGAVTVSDDAAGATLAALRTSKLNPAPSGEIMQGAFDTMLWVGETLYLVRPLIRRAWLGRSALRDADRIVHCVQDGAESRAAA